MVRVIGKRLGIGQRGVASQADAVARWGREFGQVTGFVEGVGIVANRARHVAARTAQQEIPGLARGARTAAWRVAVAESTLPGEGIARE